jgi:hypothetical protein
MSTEKITKSFLFYVVPLCLLLSYILTTCYGADLDELDDRISSVEEQLKALQAKVDANKWVTNVTAITDGFRITFSDNTSIDVKHGTNGKDGERGPAGVNGTSWAISNENIWLRDGESTGRYATGPAPQVVDGKWVFIEWNNNKIDYDTIVTDYVADTLASYVVDFGQYYELYMPEQTTYMDPEDGEQKTRLEWKMIELPKYNRALDPPLVFRFLGYGRVINEDTVQLVNGDFNLTWWYLDQIRDWDGNGPLTEQSSLWKWKWRGAQEIKTDSFMITELPANNRYAVVFSINRPNITTYKIELIDSKGNSLEAVALENARNFDNGLITKAGSNGDTVYYARIKTQPYFPGEGSLIQQKGNIYYRLLVDTFKSELSPYPINLKYKYEGLQKARVNNITDPSATADHDTFKIAYDDRTTDHSLTFTNTANLFDHYIYTDSTRIAIDSIPAGSVLVPRTFRLDSTLTPPATYKFPIYVYTLHVDGTTDKDTVWIKAE